MKNHFAKIFETLGDYQILATKEYTNEGYVLRVQTTYKDIRSAMEMGYESEVDRDKAFENFDAFCAQDFIDGVVKKLVNA